MKIWQLKVSKTNRLSSDFYTYYYSSYKALVAAMRYYQRCEDYFLIVSYANSSETECLVFCNAKVFTPAIPSGMVYSKYLDIVLESVGFSHPAAV